MPHKNSSPQAQQFVQYALSIGALELLPAGRKLKSERLSPYFFNSALFNTGASLDELACAYASVIRPQNPAVIFGPAYKGIPLAAIVARELGGNVGYAFNRKEVKDHGEGGLLVGAPVEGRRVIIVDDVITDGATKREAIEIVRAAGGTVAGLAIAFDRQERGTGARSATQEFEETFGIPVKAGATLDDLIAVLENAPAGSADDAPGEILEKILAYRKEYGVS